MVARGLDLHDRRGKGVLAEHPHDEGGREQIHRKPERLQRERNVGCVHAPVQPDRDQPDQRRNDERQHEFLVGGGLVDLERRPQALGKQRRIGFREPQSAGRAEDRAGDQEHPRRWPVQRPCGCEQQGAERDDEDDILQQKLCDHTRVPFPRGSMIA